MYIKVIRRNRPDCIVLLCQDRATEKWCFVNLTTEHVCACRFDTIDDAIADMRKREDVESFSVIGNVYDPDWKQYREYIQEEDEEQRP